MLVLSRRPGESIVIGNEVVVTVLDVRGDQIRVGIDAPRNVQIHREEVFRRLESENTQAASAAAKTRARIARLPAAADRSLQAKPDDPSEDGPTS